MNLQDIMLSERNKTQEVVKYVIPFVWNVQDWQIHRDRKRISACQGLEEKEWGVTANGVSFGGDENVLE